MQIDTPKTTQKVPRRALAPYRTVGELPRHNPIKLLGEASPLQVTRQTKGMDVSKNLYPNCDMTIWLRSCLREETEPLRGAIYNEIPSWLEGCLLRNGPGCLKVGDSEFQHLFDGLALLHRFHISKGTVTYQNRFLKSQTFKRNMAAGRIVINEFGTKSVPDPCQSIFQKISAVFERLNNPSDNAMISIFPFGDEFFALTETPVVHRIDPSDLTTKERIDIGDHVGIVSHTSHPHVTEDKTVYNLGMILSKTGPKYAILKFTPSEAGMFQTGRIVASIPSRWRFHPSYMHTFGMTENYFVIVEQPLSVSLCGVALNALTGRPTSRALQWYQEEQAFIVMSKDIGVLLGHKPACEALKCCWKWGVGNSTPNGGLFLQTVFYIVERSSGKVCHRFLSKAFFYLHIINQYEEKDHLIVDICAYKDPSMIDCMYINSLKEGQRNPDYANMFRGRSFRFVMPLRPDKNISGNLNRLPHTKSVAFAKGCDIFLEPELLCDLGCETPRIYYEKFSGRKYRYFYAISSDVDLENPGTLIKVDVEAKTRKTWCETNVFPSEPIFVPKPAPQSEDDGVILSALIWGKDNLNKVGLLILDAKTWKEVGRAVFRTSGPVPKCLHGWFVNEQYNI